MIQISKKTQMKAIKDPFYFVIVVLGLVIAASPVNAEQPMVYQQEAGIAINGYDAVAYHKVNEPIEGSESFTTMWNGATWFFVSAENRDLFVADPERWAPAYGGYCAWAVSNNYLASTDPDAFSVVNERLFLNFNKRIRNRWSKNTAKNISKGDKNWPEVLKSN